MKRKFRSKPWFKFILENGFVHKNQQFAVFRNSDRIGIFHKMLLTIFGGMPIKYKQPENTIICIDTKYNKYYVSRALKNNTNDSTTYITTCIDGKVGFVNISKDPSPSFISELFYRRENFTYGYDQSRIDSVTLVEVFSKKLKTRLLKEPLEDIIEELFMTKEEARELYENRHEFAERIFPNFYIFLKRQAVNDAIIPYHVKMKAKLKNSVPIYRFSGLA